MSQRSLEDLLQAAASPVALFRNAPGGPNVTELRAVVCPVPYVETVRKAYAPDSWRAVSV